jgi:hypothetical protein
MPGNGTAAGGRFEPSKLPRAARARPDVDVIERISARKLVHAAPRRGIGAAGKGFGHGLPEGPIVPELGEVLVGEVRGAVQLLGAEQTEDRGSLTLTSK